MRRSLFKVVGIVLIGLIALAVVILGSALGYRAYRQRENSNALAIHNPNGIQEALYADIGGLRQWLQIRGEDKSNPVILFVHGGPALSMIPFTYRSMRAWEKEFTIVHWDQRGAGRTYLLNGGADTTATGMDQIVDDGLQVSEFVRSRLHKDKIILIGESWGSAVGLEMARRRPDLFVAYIGTGQAINMERAQVLTYRLLLDRVRSEHDETALQRLTTIGPPPYTDPTLRVSEQKILGKYPAKSERVGTFEGMGGDFMSAPGYSLRESYRIIAGATQHRSKLLRDDMKYDATRRGTQFQIPIFFFQGAEDIQAPIQLLNEYEKEISAPQKDLFVFPDGGHNAFYFFSNRFLEELKARVRSLALGAPTQQQR